MVCRIFETFMKSVGVGGVPLGSKEEDWIGNFMEKLHGKLTENFEAQSGVLPKKYTKLMVRTMFSIRKSLFKILKIQSKLRFSYRFKLFRIFQILYKSLQ